MSSRIENLERAVREPRSGLRPALAAYLTAGFPTMAGFGDLVSRVAEHADLVEIGVPFSDPMADGVTIQAASHRALAQGVTLPWILGLVADLRLPVPVVLMSYLNPLLTAGFDGLAERSAAAGVSGFVVPDLPLEEAGPLMAALSARDIALIQLVTPLTPDERAARIARASQGFLYAVTRTGTTGGASADPSSSVGPWLDGLRRMSRVPVMAGFGIRSRAHVSALRESTDGVIVGSALVERVADGLDPVPFLKNLRRPGGSP